MTTKIKNFITTASAVAGSLLVAPGSLFAQENTIDLNLPAGTSFSNVSQYTPTKLAGALINLILVLAGVVAFFFLLWGGLQWILAGGDKDGTEKARKRITAALIGLVIVFSAYAIIFLAGAFLGVNLLNFSIKSVI